MLAMGKIHSFLTRKTSEVFGLYNPAKMVGRTFDLKKKVLVKLDEYSLYVMPNDYVGRSIIHNKVYEAHVSHVIKKILKPDDVFLDLGANLGYFTMMAASIVAKGNGKVISIEPNPQNQQLIFSSLEFNRFKNVVIYPFAASHKDEILKFITVGSNGGVVNRHSDQPDKFFYVQTISLDKIFIDEPRIDLIKIDVEGHEPFVLKGMENTIKRLRPKIITEFHPWALELNNKKPSVEYLDQLISYGYKLNLIDKNSGNLIENLNQIEILEFWKSLKNDTIQIDLLATP